MNIIRYFSLFLSFGLLAATLHAQDSTGSLRHDSSMVFGSMEPRPSSSNQIETFNNAWGIDLMMSTNGFGLGAFYRHEYSDDLAGYLDFSISEAKDDDEIELYDPFTGQNFVPGKVNRFLVMPLFVGVQKRLFRDDIVDNFRPYVNAAAGPTILYVFPYSEEYFTAIGHGRPKYTVGGYLGIGAYFGSERSSLFGLNIRYYFVPYPGGLESLSKGSAVVSKKQFGGLYISMSWGGSW